MKQYGEETPTFKSGAMPAISPRRTEALLGGSYTKLFRDGRRRINKDPVAWWRKQTAPASEGCPHFYHCWGW